MDFGGYLLCSRLHLRHGAQSKMKCFIPETALAYVLVFPCLIIDDSSFNADIRELYPAFSHESLGIPWRLSNLFPLIFILIFPRKRFFVLFLNKYLFCFFLFMWIIFKVFIEFVTVLIQFYVLAFWPQSM